jgi:hypothetical protein
MKKALILPKKNPVLNLDLIKKYLNEFEGYIDKNETDNYLDILRGLAIECIDTVLNHKVLDLVCAEAYKKAHDSLLSIKNRVDLLYKSIDEKFPSFFQQMNGFIANIDNQLEKAQIQQRVNRLHEKLIDFKKLHNDVKKIADLFNKSGDVLTHLPFANQSLTLLKEEIEKGQVMANLHITTVQKNFSRLKKFSEEAFNALSKEEILDKNIAEKISFLIAQNKSIFYYACDNEAYLDEVSHILLSDNLVRNDSLCQYLSFIRTELNKILAEIYSALNEENSIKKLKEIAEEARVKHSLIKQEYDFLSEAINRFQRMQLSTVEEKVAACKGFDTVFIEPRILCDYAKQKNNALFKQSQDMINHIESSMKIFPPVLSHIQALKAELGEQKKFIDDIKTMPILNKEDLKNLTGLLIRKYTMLKISLHELNKFISALDESELAILAPFNDHIQEICTRVNDYGKDIKENLNLINKNTVFKEAFDGVSQAPVVKRVVSSRDGSQTSMIASVFAWWNSSKKVSKTLQKEEKAEHTFDNL